VSTFTVGFFVGSLAKNSINRKLALALTRLAPSDLPMTEISIADLPVYSSDYDKA
jgi:chromate reductase